MCAWRRVFLSLSRSLFGVRLCMSHEFGMGGISLSLFLEPPRVYTRPDVYIYIYIYIYIRNINVQEGSEGKAREARKRKSPDLHWFENGVGWIYRDRGKSKSEREREHRCMSFCALARELCELGPRMASANSFLF